MKKATPRDRLREAIGRLDVLGEIDRLITAFIRDERCAIDASVPAEVGLRLAALKFFQKHAEAERRAAVRALKLALDPIPFSRLPDTLRWVRDARWTAPCHVPADDLRELRDRL